jgi:hypothetical protein
MLSVNRSLWQYEGIFPLVFPWISAHFGNSEMGSMRTLLAAALVASLCLLPGRTAAQQVRLLVQSSPLAGFNYHQAPDVWQAMRVGDALRLERESDNVHDGMAISVYWRGHKLGYVPRAQNAALAWAMDRGENPEARVSRLQPHRNPRKRIEFEVFVD